METIFDHNPTGQELIVLFGRTVSREEYLAVLSSQETEYGQLYRLYMLRNDPSKAAIFLDFVQDPLYRLSISMVDVLP